MPSRKKHRFSIVVPVYFNEPNLPETIPALLGLAQRLTDCELELVLVDDGSGDRSVEIIRQHQRRFPEKISLVRLTRNFGSMAAIQAGLSVANGHCVGIISADLQDPPELFVEMMAHWKRGAKVVLASRKSREDGLGGRILAGVYYRLLNLFAFKDYPQGGFDFCLVDRQVVRDLVRIEEKNTNIMSLIFWLGYTPVVLPYERRKRRHGRSHWTILKRIKLFIDSFVSFSYVPIRIITAIGFITAAVAGTYSAFILYYWLRHDHPVQGFTTLAVFIALSFGMQMTMLGILGEYLWRTLDETRKRPPYVIDEIASATIKKESR